MILLILNIRTMCGLDSLIRGMTRVVGQMSLNTCLPMTQGTSVIQTEPKKISVLIRTMTRNSISKMSEVPFLVSFYK